MQISISSVLVSACVAAAVTLITEVTAKPYIEVRKDRMLRRRRDRDELTRRLVALGHKLISVRRRASTAAFDNLPDLLGELASELDLLVSDRQITWTWMHPTIRRLLEYEAGYTAATLEATSHVYKRLNAVQDEIGVGYWERERKIYDRLLKDLDKFGSIALQYLTIPRWRIIKRTTLVRRAREASENLKNRRKEEISAKPVVPDGGNAPDSSRLGTSAEE